ncbi:unnamed protein product [Arabidopsis thaliana]|uniref:(thale cress) hypothetical protein n=1 Tax=Arabidopsis thaliana TaxID=3702 RepID=A0A7G2F8F5_ARATH|nr:unnamed protein product [Arabidopsis thaliana]
MRFWRERGRENKEHMVAPLCGQIRVLVVGDSGVGKSSLVHLIVKGSSIVRPSQTIGCTVGVKHLTYASPASSSSIIKGDSERDFFVELWDVSGHGRYKDFRSLFYSQINGVIFVHDLSQRTTKTNLQKWAGEVSVTGEFSAPLSSGGPGGLPVPYIVIGNKADIAAKGGTNGSSGNLVDAARHWVEKQGLLPHSDELPLSESFPSNVGLIMAAKEARYDKEALTKFFHMLIRRRYFSDELPSPSSAWSLSHAPSQRLDEGTSDEDQFYKRTREGDAYKYNTLPQHNLMQSPTLYPQQPPDRYNYAIPRFSLSSVEETSNGNGRSRHIQGDELIKSLQNLFQGDVVLSQMFNALMKTEIQELQGNENPETVARKRTRSEAENDDGIEEGEIREGHCDCPRCKIGREEAERRSIPIKKRICRGF